MLTSSDLTEIERNWITGLSSSDLAKFFTKYRRSELARLDGPTPNYDLGKQVQDEIAALFRLESQFRQIKEPVKSSENK